MLITCARIRDYKRIRNIVIRPEADRHLLLIGGQNMQGKTSIMDAIDAIIGGKSAVAKDPVRHGADEAVIEVEWDNGMVAKRTVTKDGTTKIEVRDKSGKVARVQQMFDELLGQRMIDPLAFQRLPPDEQRAKLLEIIDRKGTIASLDAQYAKIFEARTDVGRKVKDAEGELHRLPEPTEIAEQIDVKALAEERSRLSDQQRAGDGLHNSYQLAAKAHDQAQADLDACTRTIGELEAKLALERERKAGLTAALATHKEIVADKQAKRDAAIAAWAEVSPRADAIAADLARANAHNRAVVEAEQMNVRHAAAKRVVEERRRTYAEGTTELDRIEAKKLAFLSTAQLPVPGLGIDKDRLTLNGVPLQSASGAELLRVCLGIAIAAKSEIKDVLIRDASLLDDDSLRMVDEVVTAAGCRAWLERVGTRDPGAIIIQNGEIAE